MASASPRRPPASARTGSVPQVWGGVECSRVRVGRRVVDQLDLTGHAGRTSDIERIASLGVSAVRYPVLWEHVAPNGLARADWRWSDERLSALRAAGVQPIVGLLHHGLGPRGMSIVHPGFVAAFARYAGAVAERYPWVDAYIPINEPLTTARFGGLYGWWQPHLASREDCARLLLTQCAAIRSASAAIREINPDAKIIVNDDVGRTFSTPALAATAAHNNERRWLTWDVLFGRVHSGHPFFPMLTSTAGNATLLRDLSDRPSPPDVVGVDHYVTSDRFLDHRVELYKPERRGRSDAPFIDVEACRVAGVPVGSIRRAIDDTWQRYHAPLALTEISLAGDGRDQVAWWNDAWNAARSARAAGIDVRSVTAWALFGAVDWHCLMMRDERLYEPGAFDIRTNPPRARPVASAIAVSAKASSAIVGRSGRRRAQTRARDPRTSIAGWWTRSDRFTLTI